MSKSDKLVDVVLSDVVKEDKKESPKKEKRNFFLVQISRRLPDGSFETINIGKDGKSTDRKTPLLEAETVSAVSNYIGQNSNNLKGHLKIIKDYHTFW